MKEEWRDVVGHEDYYIVSNRGRVKTKPRLVKITSKYKNANRTHSVPAKILTGTKSSHGYIHVTLYYKGKGQQYRVHRLVAEAFIPCDINCEELQVNHKDHDKTNNYVSNLEWVTARQNSRHYQRNRVRKQEPVNSSRLTKDQVREIRRRFDEGEVVAKIARDFSHVSPATVSSAAYRNSWKWLKD